MTIDVFSALGNSTRRQLLDRLADGPSNAGDLAGQFELSRPAVAEHLQVLRRAGLVRDERDGRHRTYFLVADPLAEAAAWLHPFERFWRGRLAALAEAAEAHEDQQ